MFFEIEGNKTKLFGLNSAINGIDAINIAQAGVASPRKFSFCLSSTLNFASLSAEKTAISKAEKTIKILNASIENENCLICRLCFIN